MFLIGDIGNTEVKIFLFNSKKKILKKFVFKTNLINKKYLSKKLILKKNYLNKIQKILFSSVVPPVYSIIKLYIKKKIKKSTRSFTNQLSIK